MGVVKFMSVYSIQCGNVLRVQDHDTVNDLKGSGAFAAITVYSVCLCEMM